MRALITIIFLLSGISNLCAAPQQTIKPQQALELIHQSGLQLNVQQIPQSLNQALQQQQGPAHALMKPLLESLKSAFDPNQMMNTLAQDLTKRLDTPTMLDAFGWYNSSDGKAIISAQQSVTQPQVMEKIGQALFNQDVAVSESRKKLISDITQATQANNIALDMMVNLQAAFMSTLSQVFASGAAQDFDTLRKNFSDNKEGIRQQLSVQLMLQQMVVYEGVPETTLTSFYKFSTSPSGKKLFQALRESMDYTVQTSARKLSTTTP